MSLLPTSGDSPVFRAALAAMAMIFSPLHAVAESDPCGLVKELRAMAADHFSPQRKALIREGDYATDYLIPGASRCEVRTHEKKYSYMYCEWFMEKGLGSQPKVRKAFDDFVQGFQHCVKDKDGISVNHYKDGRGADVRLEDREAGGPPGSEFGVTITYRWFAPWWSLYLEYARADP